MKLKYIYYNLRSRLGFPHPTSLSYKIKHAHEGDIIIIDSGIYRENIRLKSEIFLLGKEPKGE